MEHELSLKKKLSQRALQLRRTLSAHEIAVLLLLSSAPIELTAGTPDFLALQDDGLVCVVEFQYALTEAGSAVLHRLGKRCVQTIGPRMAKASDGGLQ